MCCSEREKKGDIETDRRAQTLSLEVQSALERVFRENQAVFKALAQVREEELE